MTVVGRIVNSSRHALTSMAEPKYALSLRHSESHAVSPRCVVSVDMDLSEDAPSDNGNDACTSDSSHTQRHSPRFPFCPPLPITRRRELVRECMHEWVIVWVAN